MKPRITHIAPYEQSRVFLQWDLEGLDPSSPTPVFSVQRSSNHEADFETIASGLSDPFYIDDFADTDVDGLSHLAFSRSLAYRIGVDVAEVDADVVYSVGADLDGNLRIDPQYNEVPGVGLMPAEDAQDDVSPASYFYSRPALSRRLSMLRRAKVRRTVIALRLFTGVDIAVLKRRHFGERCPTCWAKGPGVVLKSRCCICYGTGWQGGYHTPIKGLGKVAMSPINTSTRAEGSVEIRQARIGLPPFPVVQKDDVIVEIASNRRWSVRTVDPKVFRTRLIKQFATCTEIGRSAIEHRVPADPSGRYLLAYAEDF